MAPAGTGGALIILALIGAADCRIRDVGGTTIDETDEGSYPSLSRRYYYTFYIAYFTPSGLYYADVGLDSSRTVRVCTNNEPYFGNDTVLGDFPCPMENDPDSFKYCCGDSGYQYCCRLQDTLSFQLGLGLGIVCALGVIFTVIFCFFFTFKAKKKAREQHRAHQERMKSVGIPQYPRESNRMYSVEQAEDGYCITVRFKSKDYYTKFTQVLQAKYPKIGWKANKVKNLYEGKLTYPDGEWVSFTLSPGGRGSEPSLVVARETIAFNWMISDFQEIVDSLPDTRLCPCLSTRNKKTFPSPSSSTKSRNTESTKADDDDIRLEPRNRKSSENESRAEGHINKSGEDEAHDNEAYYGDQDVQGMY